MHRLLSRSPCFPVALTHDLELGRFASGKKTPRILEASIDLFRDKLRSSSTELSVLAHLHTQSESGC
jgi:hypothetical protein